MKLETFLNYLFLFGGILIAITLLFGNKIVDWFFNWIEPHPNKELFCKYEKLYRRVGYAYTPKQIEKVKIEVAEFEVNNKHCLEGVYYTTQLKNLLRGKELKLSVDMSAA